MKTDIVILGLACLWAIYWTLRNKHIFSGLITAGLIAGVALSFFKLNNSITLGVSVFLAFAMAALAYTLFYKKFSSAKRMVISLIILPPTIYWVFLINHLAGASWMWYSLFLPFIGLIYGLTKPVNLKNEWGFIIILLAESFTHIYPIIINQNLI